MPRHSLIKSPFGFVLAAMSFTAAWTLTAQADEAYQPYYLPSARDTIQFSNVVPPQPAGVPVTPQYAPGQPSNWQPVPVTLQETRPTAASLPLGTFGGFNAGIAGSYYHFGESNDGIRDEGPQMAATADATLLFGDHWYDTADFRYAYGRVDYNSHASGSTDDHENSLWEIRDVVGRDFIVNDSVLWSPYLGIGYRSLYTDNRGGGYTGISGFQRDSRYLYIPIGIAPQFRIDGRNRVTLDLEYDYFAQGWQTSHLGDLGNGDPNVHNNQGSGNGFRASAMWQNARWSLGPFMNYWNVNTSATQPFTSPRASCGSTACTYTEPRNVTVEGGLQLKYRFFDF